jgi:hypothetical protein
MTKFVKISTGDTMVDLQLMACGALAFRINRHQNFCCRVQFDPGDAPCVVHLERDQTNHLTMQICYNGTGKFDVWEPVPLTIVRSNLTLDAAAKFFITAIDAWRGSRAYPPPSPGPWLTAPPTRQQAADLIATIIHKEKPE